MAGDSILSDATHLEGASHLTSHLHPIRIETARLILRTVTLDDVEQVALHWNLDGVPISRQEAEEKARWMLENHRHNVPGRLTHLCLAIVDKEAQAFAGWCGLDHRDQSRPAPVLFYLLKASYWGKGLATEAARAVLDYAFAELRLDRVDGGAAPENLASKRVMEKIGMTYVGLNAEGGYCFTSDARCDAPGSMRRNAGGTA